MAVEEEAVAVVATPHSVKVTDLGSVNIQSISNGFALPSSKTVNDGLVDASETVKIFEWVNANSNINTTELAKYNVTVNGNKMN